VPVKRVDLAIEAFSAMAAARPEWDLVVIGDGPLGASLNARVPALIRERVVWTGFIGCQRRVSAIYRCSDVLVVPSDFEPWGVVLNEAAAAGLAIVATEVVGAAAELVQPGVNGERVPPGDAEALGRALLRVTDPAHLEDYRNGSARVLAEWRERGDPVNGLRAALLGAGVLRQAGWGSASKSPSPCAAASSGTSSVHRSSPS
jgi:glycosyltransferase involved in cell wall biosynthesis